MHNLGDAIGRQGDWRAAETLLLECLSIRNQLGDHFGIGATVGSLATVCHGIGDTVRAVRLAAGAAALRLTYKTPLAPSDRAAVEQDIETFRASLPERDYEAAWAFGSALSLDRLVTYAREQRLIPSTQPASQLLRL